MVKKNNSSLNTLAGACAFVALIIAGISHLLALFGESLGVFALVGNVCLVLSTIITAGLYVNSSAFPWKSKFWVILYWVIVIIALVSLFL